MTITIKVKTFCNTKQTSKQINTDMSVEAYKMHRSNMPRTRNKQDYAYFRNSTTVINLVTIQNALISCFS